MQNTEYLQIIALVVVLLLLGVPLGAYMARIYDGKTDGILTPLRWIELRVYRLIGVNSATEMTWKQYVAALLVFNLFGFIVLYLMQILQNILPLNPAGMPPVPAWLALNTAVSFVTNTNWQAYSGEASMSLLTQMAGLGVQNFVSAATGMAVAVALARGIARKSSPSIGNFWVDLTRSILYILLPLSLVFAVVLVSQGVVQNFSPNVVAKTVEGIDQVLPMGPAASQIAIKQLGTNGGGFFGVNSAHPFENPNPISNFLQILAILLIPFATPIMFGRMVGNRKHGIALLAAMTVLFTTLLVVGLYAETHINPVLGNAGAMEGKEVRFGVLSSILWTISTTATSNGSVNAMISSMSPLAGGVALLNIMLGEVVYGGVGCGLYGIVMFAVLTVFIAGLMVGRTPEYLGKKIEAREIKFAVIAAVVPSILILGGAAIAATTDVGLSSLLSKGPHGLSEILYAFSSAAGNNGSAFAGLNANTPFYNCALAICMLLGRFLVIVPVLGIAGSLSAKKFIPPSQGTFPIEGGLFTGLLIAVILIVGALTFFPALSLGPIAEHLLMVVGRTF